MKPLNAKDIEKLENTTVATPLASLATVDINAGAINVPEEPTGICVISCDHDSNCHESSQCPEESQCEHGSQCDAGSGCTQISGCEQESNCEEDSQCNFGSNVESVYKCGTTDLAQLMRQAVFSA